MLLQKLLVVGGLLLRQFQLSLLLEVACEGLWVGTPQTSSPQSRGVKIGLRCGLTTKLVQCMALHAQIVLSNLAARLYM